MFSKHNNLILLICSVFISFTLFGCATYSPMTAKIDKIDRAQARSVFMEKLIEQQIDDTIGTPAWSSIRNSIPYAFPRYIKNGDYKFVGARSTSNERFIVFLYEPNSSSFPKFGAYAFKFGQNPSARIFKNDNPQPGKFQYYVETTDLEYCYGQTTEEPIVTDTHGKSIFSTSDSITGKVTNYACWPYDAGFGEALPHFYFRSYDAMIEFTQILISAFPYVNIQ